MTATLSHDSPAVFELASAKTWPHPWPMYKALRDHDPVHHVVPPEEPEHDYFVLSRHADVWAAARDHETFSSAQGLTVNYGELELIGLQDNPPMVMQGPAGAHRVPQARSAGVHAASSGGRRAGGAGI